VTTVPAKRPAAPARRRTLLDRVLSAFPLVALVFVLFVFYGVEAWSRKTPWIFTDEMEWTQISRSIAATGHAARRGEPISFKSLYAVLIAPFWWIRSTATAYAAIKYANVVIMTSTAIPTYLLARMLVSRRGAIAAAVASVAVPAMAYVTTIIIEVVAYPYCALCSWLSVRAFRSGRRRDIALAAAVDCSAILVRSPQFVTIPAAFVIAGAGLFVTGPRGRAIRRNWGKGDTLGAIVLLLGALFLFNRVVLQHVYEWQFTTQYYKNRMVDLGLRAALSLTIGLGILPVVCGLTALRLPDRRGDPAYRAFAAWLAAAIFCISLYTADKAAYLSTTFATLWEERNLIYLSPLMLVATVLVFESKRVDWRLVAAASAFVAFLLVDKGFQTDWPYFEAPGFAIPAIVHAYEGWSIYAERVALLGVLAFSLVLLAARRLRGVSAFVLLLGLAWLLSGEIANTVGIDRFANEFRANLPAQLDWVDVASHDQPVTYLGQAIVDANGELLTEFWNRSIKHVESLDGTASGPGPTSRPLVLNAEGLLSGISGNYVLADNGVALDGTSVAHEGEMVLYHHVGRWHLLDNSEQLYTDSWCPEYCAYNYFKPHQRGTLKISLSRTAYQGPVPPAQVTILVGTIRINSKDVPVLHQLAVIKTQVANQTQKTISIPVATTPVRVELRTLPSTLIPPKASDPRTLAVQAAFTFGPDKQR
jgi:hypothetical protein